MGRLLRRVLSRCLRTMDGHLSRDYVAAALQRSTRKRDGQPHSSLSDLAPDEVYLAGPITRTAGGLLHHRFSLTRGLRFLRSTDPWRSTLCCTFSRVAPGGCYPPSCPVEPGRSSAVVANRRDRLADPFECRAYGTPRAIGPLRIHAAAVGRAAQPLSASARRWALHVCGEGRASLSHRS
ncbi:MAG: hypothetical protein JWO10_1606 [Microbacteriaceae bacterium]|nr:hypothetical protein [Microbacteriaceae bacterium]